MLQVTNLIVKYSDGTCAIGNNAPDARAKGAGPVDMQYVGVSQADTIPAGTCTAGTPPTGANQTNTRVAGPVSFMIGAGESVALIGANGAGKTSLLLALTGVLPPASGEIRVFGAAFNKQTLRDVRKRVGMVFQNPDDQLFMPNIYEDVAFGPRGYGYNEDDVAKRADGALRKLGIAGLAERSPLKLSGGEKRLAAIATVLSMNPDFILFDEPTAFLDPRARRGLAEVISGLPQGKLIATHDLAFVESVCTRVLLLQNGALVYDGGPDILRDARALEAAGL